MSPALKGLALSLSLSLSLLGGSLGCGKNSTQDSANHIKQKSPAKGEDNLPVESLPHHQSEADIEALLKLDQLTLSQIKILEAHLFQLINEYRVSKGQQKLIYDSRISDVAREHSRQMSKGQVDFGHDLQEERFARIKTFSPYREGGEIVAYNYNHVRPLRSALRQWQESPGHHRLMIYPWNKGGEGRSGLGIAKGQDKEYYFTQIFIMTRNP